LLTGRALNLPKGLSARVPVPGSIPLQGSFTAVRESDFSLPDSRKGVAMRDDRTRIDPEQLKLGAGP